VKAITRGEKTLARTALNAIAELTIHFLEARKRNLVLQRAPAALFLSVTSDISVVTDRVYENLQEVAQVAIGQSDESTAISVIHSYRRIAIHLAQMQAQAFRENDRPLVFAPIHWILECVKRAQAKGLNEVPFQTAAALADIAVSAPKDVTQTDIAIPVFNGLADIALHFYATRLPGLAEDVNGKHFLILARMLNEHDFYFDDALRHVLEKMELLAPFAIASASITGPLSVVHPLNMVYALTNENSLGYLFAKAVDALTEVDTERDWLNPYHDVVEVLDIIAEHARKVGEQNEFGGSFMLWELNRMIRHIAMVVAARVREPIREGRGDEDKLTDELRSLLSFYWVAFRRKQTIHERWADECCDTLAYIGITFFELREVEVVRHCASNIRWIFEAYCETARPRSAYAAGDILAHLWELRLLFVRREELELVQFVDGLLETKPEGLSDDEWEALQRGILLRRNQLEERLRERDRRSLRESAEELLRSILSGARRANR
jgi:hypothetical protein